MAKYYSVDEANALLPRLSRMLREIQVKMQELEPRRRRLEALGPKAKANGHLPEIERLAGEVEAIRKELQRALETFTELGVEVKDLQSGLLDFRTLRDGREVYL